MEQEEYKPDNFARMDKLCGTLRGRIIQAMTNVEAVIDDSLTEYFCTSPIKKEEFKFAFVTSDYIPLSSKWKMLNNILIKQFPKLLKATEEGAYVYFNPITKYGVKLNARMITLIETRNVAAHRIFYAEKKQINEFDDKTVYLKAPKLEKGEWTMEYYPLTLNEEMVDEFKIEAGIVNMMFDKIIPIIIRGFDLSEEELKSTLEHPEFLARKKKIDEAKKERNRLLQLERKKKNI